MATNTFTGDAAKNLSANQAEIDPHICFPPLTKRLQAVRRNSVRRHVSPLSGRALEILGHAIEYLADEYVVTAAQQGMLVKDDPYIDAMHILMSLNREVYYACPEVEAALPRIARWLFRSCAPRTSKRQVN